MPDTDKQSLIITRSKSIIVDLDELFEGKVFVVPDYQRMYSWEEKNWNDLWNDVLDVLETKTPHYWGTITLRSLNKQAYCEEEDKYFNVYEVVDGQQRLATLYLLISALADTGKKVLKKRFIKCGEVYRLELGAYNRDYLKKLVDGNIPVPEIKSNKLLRDCYMFFKSKIENYLRNGGSLDELSKALQKLTFALQFVVEEYYLAIKAFESLNDRGKPLTLLDKVKSYLMFISARYLNNKLNEEIFESFGEIFLDYDIIKDIGEQEGITYIKNRLSEDELLRFFYHYFCKYAIKKYELNDIVYYYDVSAEDVFEQFIKRACNLLNKDKRKLNDFILDFLENFQKFTKAFRNIIERTKTDCIYQKLFIMLGLNARVYPLIIALEAEGLLDEEMLKLIEALDLRVYKLKGTDPRADLYRNVISEIKLLSKGGRTQIIQNTIDFIQEFMPSPLLYITILRDPLHKNPATKYILWLYEKEIDPTFNECNIELYKNVEIEHILPQSPDFDFPAYGFNTKEEYEEYKHRIGNLCLIEKRLNKLCGNNPPHKKQKYYKESKLPRTKVLGNTIETFNKEKISSLSEKIALYVLNKWHVEGDYEQLEYYVRFIKNKSNL